MRASRTSSSLSKKATTRKQPAKAQEGHAGKLSGNSSSPGAQWTPALAPIAVCVYIAGFVLPFQWDIPLIVLALMSITAFASGSREGRSSWPPLTLPVAIFLAATGISILASADIARSLRLSTPFIPGVLLFFLIAEYFRDIRDIHILYLTLSAVALGLAAMLLWGSLTNGPVNPSAALSDAASPILLVPNDTAFLAVIAPLSLVLFCRKPKSMAAVLAAFSLLVTVGVVVIFQSRTALLTIIASLTCAAVLMQPRRRLMFGLASSLAIPVLALLIDAAVGSPLITKFIRQWEGSGRLPLWQAAWAMFLDAPLLGHGPHTYVLFYKSYLHDLGLPVSPRVVPWVHNLYLETLAEQGIMGLASLGFLLARGVSAAWSIQYTASDEARLLSAGALGSLIGLCIAAVLELSFLRQWVIVILFVLFGVIAQLSSLSSKDARGDRCSGTVGM